MVKHTLIFLFCLSIMLQSLLGQFLLVDQTTGTFSLLPSVVSLLTGNSEAYHTYTEKMRNKYGNGVESEVQENKYDNQEIIRDSIMGHLFSPFNCQDKSSHILTIFSFLYTKNSTNLIDIEGRINTFVHFYASFFKNIQVRLPVKKIIFPFHNFY